MAWLGLVDPDTGDLVGVGTESMIGPDTPDRLIVHEFGATMPDFGTHLWNRDTRSLELRPVRVLIDRLDDIEAWLMADPDFANVWGTLSAARRTTIRTGIRRVLVRVAGARRFRDQTEPAELD